MERLVKSVRECGDILEKVHDGKVLEERDGCIGRWIKRDD